MKLNEVKVKLPNALGSGPKFEIICISRPKKMVILILIFILPSTIH